MNYLPFYLNKINSIKLLNKYKVEIKDLIKINNSKIKVINNYIKELNDNIEKNNKKINKSMSQNKVKKRYVCPICAVKKLTKKDLESHICRFVYFRNVDYRKETIYDHILHEALKENHILNNDLESKIKTIKITEKSNLELNSVLIQVNDRIKNLSLTCHKCKKKVDVNNYFLEEVGCKYNHILCNKCFDNNDECPLCFEILQNEICPICLERKKNIIDVKCGNNHRICKKCINTILDTQPKCPFCRVKIKNIESN